MIMPYFAHGDLRKELKRRKEAKLFYTEQEIVDLMTQMASAVEFLHSKNLMHRYAT